MATTNTLRMKFVTDLGKEATISVGYCKTDLTAETVQEAMDSLIAGSVFAVALSSKAGADIVERTVIELF